jgi:hypothetical protein
MPDNNLLRKTWLGIGLKGGIILNVGGERIEGRVFNLQNVSNQAHFSLSNYRLGVGLGVSGGLIAICVLNCLNIHELNGRSNDGWDVNISLGGNWGKLVKTLKDYKFFFAVANIGPKIRIQGPNLETIRNCLHYLYNAYGAATAGNELKVICFDIPAGLGFEVSIAYSFGGRIKIY